MRFERNRGFYEKHIKRLLDIVCSLLAIVFFSWLYVVIAIMIRIRMGSPVLFRQPRPGIIKNGKETVFDIYKFRTMTDDRDENGKLLPDKMRMPKFGAWLRRTGLDEIPEAFNIIKGDMSVIGPRPQLVRDMVFMTDRQRMRHTAKPGLGGLAQTRGRNSISWEEKLEWDLKYIEKVSFWGDLKLVLATLKTAFIDAVGITDGENTEALDFGDTLLKEGKVSQEEYDALQAYAADLIAEHERKHTRGKDR